MKYHFFSLVVFILCCQISFAQSEVYRDWSRELSGGSAALFRTLHIDQHGDLLVNGYFNEKIVTNSTPWNTLNTLGKYDMATFKLNNNGKIIWINRAGVNGNIVGFFRPPNLDGLGNLNFDGTLFDSLYYETQNGVDHIVTNRYYDIMLRQIDNNGKHKWIGQIGGIHYDILEHSFTNNANEFYVQGRYFDFIDIDPGPEVEIANPILDGTAHFILKMDASGNKLWSKIFDEEPIRVEALDDENSIYASKTFMGEADLDLGAGITQVNTQGDSIRYVQKFDKDLNLIWYSEIKGFGLIGNQVTRIDPFGNIYNYGWFQDTILIVNNGAEQQLSSQNGTNIYIQKLDADGNLLGIFQLPNLNLGTSNALPNMKFDDMGNLFVVGRFAQTVDFNLGPDSLIISSGSSGNRTNIFVLKIDPNGNLLWANQFGSIYHNERISGFHLDGEGNFYTAGIYKNSIDVDPGINENILYGLNNYNLGYLLKWNAEGEFIWADRIRKSGYNISYFSMNMDQDDNIFVAGGFDNTDFNGDDIAFVYKYEQCSEVFNIDEQVACDEFTWIDGNTYYAEH